MLHLLQCFHCPAADSRWLVVGDRRQVVEEIHKHIDALHPNTGQWVEDDDWADLDEESTRALDAHLASIQS